MLSDVSLLRRIPSHDHDVGRTPRETHMLVHTSACADILEGGMDQQHPRSRRAVSVDYGHGRGGAGVGFDVASTDLRTWLAQWPRVMQQLDTLVVGLKRR